MQCSGARNAQGKCTRETKQPLHKCMAQHRRASGQDSAVKLHLKDTGHSFEDNNVHSFEDNNVHFKLERPSVNRGGDLRHHWSATYNAVLRSPGSITAIHTRTHMIVLCHMMGGWVNTNCASHTLTPVTPMTCMMLGGDMLKWSHFSILRLYKTTLLNDHLLILKPQNLDKGSLPGWCRRLSWLAGRYGWPNPHFQGVRQEGPLRSLCSSGGAVWTGCTASLGMGTPGKPDLAVGSWLYRPSILRNFFSSRWKCWTSIFLAIDSIKMCHFFSQGVNRGVLNSNQPVTVRNYSYKLYIEIVLIISNKRFVGQYNSNS